MSRAVFGKVLHSRIEPDSGCIVILTYFDYYFVLAVIMGQREEMDGNGI